MGLPLFFVLMPIQGVDVGYGFPFRYGFDQRDVAGDQFPFLAGFNLFAFAADTLLGVGLVFLVARLFRRGLDRSKDLG